LYYVSSILITRQLTDLAPVHGSRPKLGKNLSVVDLNLMDILALRRRSLAWQRMSPIPDTEEIDI